MNKAYRLTRKDGAPGIVCDGDGLRGKSGGQPSRPPDLLTRIKEGRYIAPPVRRHYITRRTRNGRLGISDAGRQVTQRAILLVLEPVCAVGLDPPAFGGALLFEDPARFNRPQQLEPSRAFVAELHL